MRRARVNKQRVRFFVVLCVYATQHLVPVCTTHEENFPWYVT